MTLARAFGAAAFVAVVVQCAMIWQGVIACVAVGLLLAAAREESGR